MFSSKISEITAGFKGCIEQEHTNILHLPASKPTFPPSPQALITQHLSAYLSLTSSFSRVPTAADKPPSHWFIQASYQTVASACWNVSHKLNSPGVIFAYYDADALSDDFIVTQHQIQTSQLFTSSSEL